MIRISGPSFDDLDPQIEACERLVTRMTERIMEDVASELGAVRVAAGKPPPKRLPGQEPLPPPPPPPPPDPGEPAVSLDTLALIVTLWADGVGAELIPFLRGVWGYAASRVRFQLTGAVPPERSERIPALESESTQLLAEAYLADAPNRVSGFAAEMWDVARAQLLEGFMEGESIDSLRDRLRTNVPELTAARARTIARTEVISASNAGSLSMVELAEFGGTKSWLATEDERTRPTHTLADGQTVAMADAFIVGGFPLHFPGDPSGPLQEIVNCRCTTTYDLDDDPLIAAGGTMVGEWIGVLTLEGAPSGDGRMFAPDTLTWADLPLPLLWQRETGDGHDGSEIVGDIREISRAGNQIIGRGTFDLSTSEGAEAAKRVGSGYLRGVSVDVDSLSADTMEYLYGEDADGEPVISMVIFHGGRLRGATLCAIPAFAEAFVQMVPESTDMSLAATDVPVGVDGEAGEYLTDDPLVAASYVLTIPDVPPAAWFAEPSDVDIHGALTVTDEGRVYGYLAPSGVAHRSFRERVTVPMGNVDYSLFMGRETLVAGGGRVVTGALTMDCGHASTGYRDPAMAMDHYDNACSVVATVRIGENARGVWVAGALVPGLTANQISRIMACQLSGDWRPHRGKSGWREFAGALLVPVPGFAMARTEASVKVLEEALVASTVPVEFKETDSECGCRPQASDLSAELETLARSVGLGLSDKMDTLRRAVHQLEV